jgi:tRNA (mo5U34)-methyltransferase
MKLPGIAGLWRALSDLGMDTWQRDLEPLVESRLNDAAHGDFARWRAALAQLPGAENDPDRLKPALLELAPWRKGPFDLGGVRIDSEWRSDLKWARLGAAIEPLAGRAVLDVGSGNGYYALRMRESGAGLVVGIDPTILYVLQFLAVQHFRRVRDVFVLPLRLHELPLPARCFDTTFSMGVLYHQRSPIDHLLQLRDTLRPGGQLVLETLFVPGEEGYSCTPPARYARMRNVWMLPTITELGTWLRRAGFGGVEIVDRSVTTPAEQRTTEWMPFESLAEALDPDEPGRTVEGWPAPRRVVVVAQAP